MINKRAIITQQALKEAQLQRDMADKKHDGLCISKTTSFGMTCCWCIYRLCWDRTGRRCVCLDCPCEKLATASLLPMLNSGIRPSRRTLY